MLASRESSGSVLVIGSGACSAEDRDFSSEAINLQYRTQEEKRPEQICVQCGISPARTGDDRTHVSNLQLFT